METKMAQIAIYLGADRIISACGLTTRENMEAIGGGRRAWRRSGTRPFAKGS